MNMFFHAAHNTCDLCEKQIIIRNAVSQFICKRIKMLSNFFAFAIY